MKQRDRVLKTIYISIAIGCIFTFSLAGLMEIWPKVFASLFIAPSSDTMEMCASAIRIYFIMLTLLPINFIGTAYFQYTAQNGKAFILSICRQGVFLIPAIIMLPKYFGLNGIWMATPLSDFLSISLTIIFLLFETKRNSSSKRVLNNVEN
jgi:Na+-driven multidrug efflux pump